MDSFTMNLTLMQATIVEQQITNFVLENEYEKQLGLVSENSKLKDAGKWIKERIDHFINIIKTWFGKIMNFLTKTLPEWAAKKKKWILELLDIRQKAVKIDDSKISQNNKEKVKETCKKASRLNIFKFFKRKNKDDDLDKDLKDLVTSSENLLKKAEDVHQKNQELLKKWDENQKKNEEFDKQAEKDLQKARDFLKNLEANSDDAAEKSELKKAADAIEQGKTVEMSSEKLDYLEGNLIDLDYAKKYLDFCSDAFYKLEQAHSADYGDLSDPNEILFSLDHGYHNDDIQKYKDDVNDRLKRDAMKRLEYKRYKELKKQNKINLSSIPYKKTKLKKETLNEQKDFYFHNLKALDYFATDNKKFYKETVDLFNELKSKQFVDPQIINAAIRNANVYMEDANLIIKDMFSIKTLIYNSLVSFSATAKPCSGN